MGIRSSDLLENVLFPRLSSGIYSSSIPNSRFIYKRHHTDEPILCYCVSLYEGIRQKGGNWNIDCFNAAIQYHVSYRMDFTVIGIRFLRNTIWTRDWGLFILDFEAHNLQQNKKVLQTLV